MRAAIYARVSSAVQGKEDRYSLPDQLDKCRAFVRQAGGEVVFETTERHSGATLHRPKIEELFERALAGEFDTIVAHEQDRLSREPKDAAYLEVHARLHGIRLICLDTLPQDGTTLSETEEMKQELERMFAKWERHKIYFRTSERRKRRAAEGKLNPGNSPLYGYLWNDERKHAKTAYIEDPQAALVVRRIFESVVAGRSLLALARQLTTEQVLPPAAYHAAMGLYPTSRLTALHWRPTTIASIIRNPAYWGEHVAFRRKTTKEEVHANGKTREQLHSGWRKTAEEGLIALPQETCPPLVRKELAEAAHRQLALNKRQATKDGAVRLVLLRGGIAVCGYCGGILYCLKTRPGKTRYYCSRTRLKYHVPRPMTPCEGGAFSVPTSEFDAAVWECIMQALTNPGTLSAALAQHEAEVESNQRMREERMKTMQHLAAQKKREQERLIRTLSEQEDEDTRKLISAHLKTLAGEVKQVASDLETEQRLYQEPSEQRDAIKRLVAWGERKRGELEEASVSEKRQILFWLGARVKVWKTNHQPSVEVWLFAAEGNAGPILLGKMGSSHENENSESSSNIIPTTSAPCPCASNCGRIILPSL